MKLKEISIKKLFGIFDHNIKINTDTGITIIIGENGLGKTKILEIVEAFFNENYFKLSKIKFDCLIFKFEDNVSWEVKKKESSFVIRQKGENDETTGDFDLKWKKYDIDNPHILRRAIQIARINEDLIRISHGLWKSRLTDDYYTALDIVEKFDPHSGKRIKHSLQDRPQWFNEGIKSVKVSLIETQRVFKLNEHHSTLIETVKEYSDKLSKLIKQKLEESTELSSKLDRTYPNRLVQKLNDGDNFISDKDLFDKLKKLEEKRNLLDEVGLVEIDENFDLPYMDNPEDTVKNVLMLYVEDSFKKLEIFEEIAKKIKLLLKIINERFKHKKLYVNKEEGFVFKSTVLKDGDNFKKIPLKQLSSGEKNELILFYHLIFNTSPNSLILIDEPEISLHISWQNKFISDLKKIHNLNKLDILIATHSPDIISNNWDLSVELKGVE